MQRKRFGEWWCETIIQVVAYFSIASIALIFVFVFREAWPLIGGNLSDETGVVSLFRLFIDKQWMPVSNHPLYGIIALLMGSFKITAVAIVIAVPIGVACALYNVLFTPRWMRDILKPAIELLAGFPSVVIGFFGLMVLASVVQRLFGLEYRLNAFISGVALSLAVIPIIFTIAEDALSSIPTVYREASYALGAQKWETGLFVLMPIAMPGIFAAIILGFGRAFGETMIVLMTSGNAVMASFDIFKSTRTMAATIGAEMAEVVFGDAHYTALYFIGSILFLISFSLNAITEFYIKEKMMQRLKGN
ncbi:MAG: phosphate ABC transporter permease subunit PstC [Chitinivibrionales bacterium]|nr:phosphate ABC transporter permease subunit PstC [Chitinivibrionales bacterium]